MDGPEPKAEDAESADTVERPWTLEDIKSAGRMDIIDNRNLFGEEVSEFAVPSKPCLVKYIFRRPNKEKTLQLERDY
jgi:hypothetical protein